MVTSFSPIEAESETELEELYSVAEIGEVKNRNNNKNNINKCSSFVFFVKMNYKKCRSRDTGSY